MVNHGYLRLAMVNHGYQWLTMEHAGVSFPEPYEPHGVKILYDGKAVNLTPAEEEA